MDLYKLDIDNNLIKITKKYEYYSPIVYGIKNNKKHIINNLTIDNTELFFKNNNYNEIIISDNNTFQRLQILYKKEHVTDKITVTSSYLKGKLTLYLTFNDKYNYDKLINVTGDLNKSVYLLKNNNTLTINFVHQIFGFVNLNFNINNIHFTLKVIDKEKFPKNIIKINNGIKLNEYCNYDLTLKTNLGNYIFKAGKNELILDLEGIKYLQLYFDEILIIEQNLIKDKFVPLLSILENPLRLKLSQKTLEDVKVNINGNYYIINQGDTEKIINIKGIINILNYENCIFEGKKVVFNI